MTDLLYHGTRAGFRGTGGLVLPGDQFGTDHHRLGRSDAVYVTPDLDLAWAFAEAAGGRGRPKVLVVEPFGPLERDDSTVGGDEHESYRTDAALVVAIIKAPPS